MAHGTRRFFMLIGSNECPSLKSRVTIGQPPVNVFPFVFVNVRGCACSHWLIHGLGFLATDWLKYDPPCSTCLVMRGWKILPAVWSRTALFPPPYSESHVPIATSRLAWHSDAESTANKPRLFIHNAKHLQLERRPWLRRNIGAEEGAGWWKEGCVAVGSALLIISSRTWRSTTPPPTVSTKAAPTPEVRSRAMDGTTPLLDAATAEEACLGDWRSRRDGSLCCRSPFSFWPGWQGSARDFSQLFASRASFTSLTLGE